MRGGASPPHQHSMSRLAVDDPCLADFFLSDLNAFHLFIAFTTTIPFPPPPPPPPPKRDGMHLERGRGTALSSFALASRAPRCGPSHSTKEAHHRHQSDDLLPSPSRCQTALRDDKMINKYVHKTDYSFEHDKTDCVFPNHSSNTLPVSTLF
ncbi:hypothetical protein E2C01_049501 [Portunus trituberculatus]|uniref:Uncharacterized protein n=1 Tax=Portunus trituberculatus TaxID=210409 RepID=A0A5B7GD95_PORTR|nr:hypothetical protein [Portunus trituberculatus]